MVPHRELKGAHDIGLIFCHTTGWTKGRKRSREGNVILQEPGNGTMVQLALEAPVKELGHVFPRLLDLFMATVPVGEYFSKMDLADGYWHMLLDPNS